MLTRVLSVLAFMALLGALVSVHVQAQEEQPEKKGGKIEAQGREGKKGDVDVKDICVIKRKLKTKLRVDYEPWMKDLICDFLFADFRDKDTPKQYVAKVLAAFRSHHKKPGMLVSEDRNIVHIVTEDPAHAEVDWAKEIWKVHSIDSAKAKRSWRDPVHAAIGINSKKYFPPRGPKNKHTEVRKAEEVLRIILAIKKFADLVNQNPKGKEEKAVKREVTAAITAFQNSQLLQFRGKEPPSFKASEIEPKPDLRSQGSDGDAAQGLGGMPIYKEHFPTGDRAKRAKDVKAGDRLGVTVPATDYLKGRSVKAIYIPEGVESIEPKPLLKPGYIAKVVVRTLLLLHSYYGVVPKESKNGDQVIKVVKLNGDDCTGIIKEHEMRHIQDSWKAWNKEMIQAVAGTLDYERFDKATKRKFEGHFKKEISFRQVKSEKFDDMVYIDILASYYFSNKDEKKAKNAAETLEERTSKKKVLKQFHKNYIKANKELEDAFHTKEEGLDENCNPLKGGDATVSFGAMKPGKAPIEEAPEVKGKR